MSLARLLDALPGWMMLVGGVALIACSMVVPSQLATASLVRQQDALHAHLATRLARVEHLRMLAAGLEQRDPALMARLAHDRWRMAPSDPDTTVLTPATPDRPLALDALPVTPVPSAFQTPDTALNRLTTGPYRAVLPTVGLVFVAAGVAFPWHGRGTGD
jgi:hypothetical protein